MKSIVFEIFEYSVLYIWNYSIGIICIWNRLFSKFSSIRYSVLDFIDFEVLFNEVYVHKNYSIGIIIYSSIRYWLFDFIDFDILFDEVCLCEIITFEIFEYSVFGPRFHWFRYSDFDEVYLCEIIIFEIFKYSVLDFIDFDVLFDEVYVCEIIVFEIFEYSVFGPRF